MEWSRQSIIELMNDVYTSKEAAEYLNITTQRLNQLVHDQLLSPIKSTKSVNLFLKSDLDERRMANYANMKLQDESKFDIDNQFVRDAILYYTVQQYRNNSDSKTAKFMNDMESLYGFDYHSGIKHNIPLLAKHLNVTDQEFYNKYLFVKDSFQRLSADVVLIKKGDDLYSKLLMNTNEAPPYLFLKGDITLLNESSVCVVGSRNASVESMQKTERLVRSLVSRNIVVNAGLAKGIDTATHTAALDNGGKTIAVIGTPINQYYPKENKQLQMRIEKEGLVVSQFPPCNKIQRWNFPTRNGVMSGLSIATIIMEAGETSGALKQADYALKQSRDVLIPQAAINNTSISWPRAYEKKGAKVFTKLTDVIDYLSSNPILSSIFNSNEGEGLNDVEMD